MQAKTKLRLAGVVAGAVMAMAAQPASAVVFFIQTGHTTAQVQLDSAHPNNWVLNPTSNFDFGGGIFTMKDGSSTTADILLTVYNGATTASGVLRTVTISHSLFCDLHDGVQDNVQDTHCNQFQPVKMEFASVANLASGGSYLVQLLSQSAPDVQSQAYFIKGLDTIYLPTGGGEPPPPPAQEPIPEPMSLALLGAALAGLGAARRRR